MLLRINKALNERRAGLKREEGFTLIELLVVVIIIGILAAIAIPVFLGVQKSAADSGVKSDLANAKIAVVAYFTDGQTGAPAMDATDLGPYGFTQGDNTSSIDFNATGTDPDSVGDTFCIEAEGTTGDWFHITDSTGVAEGDCTP